ncbi:hypothetical protein DI383_14445 [Flavobacteriaceae bacterium LYZ1037]|uniref:Uncharacterized protein n=1 Tax=Formosa maritima TaxID=2592046 RepID=A0A5D0G3Z6_9FLAO|nr:hypothetical protein [Formosa maritima]PWI28879.1 hypothetical protein DI383_14445 [Flavobacteriaceae bacterium LYZ1037]TYA52732.1 hypothetical protein FVF61_11870 [Formosa maritima]
MKNSLNIFHYSIYLMHYKLHLLANKINPFRLLHKLPFQKRKYQQLGIDIDEEVNKAFRNKEYGLSIRVSGGLTIGVIFILFFSLSNIIIKILNINVVLNVYFFAFIFLISLAICYYLVFKENKYLEYFKEYGIWTKKDLIKNVWISFGFIIGLILLFFASLLMF